MSSIPAALNGQTILVTGGAGFVGSVFLYRLVHGPINPKRVYAIVRGPDAFDRMPPFLKQRACRVQDVGTSKERPLVIVQGDASKVGFSLEPAIFDLLWNTVQIVVHAAAVTKFNLGLFEAIESNVSMTQTMVHFSISAPLVKAHVHVSSCFIHLWLPDGSTVHESTHQRPSIEQENTYSHAKHISEGIVEAFAKSGSSKCRFVNIRLSSIGPSLEYPHAGYGSLLKAAPIAAGVSCDDLRPGDFPADAFWDTVPADVCIDQMLALIASTLGSASAGSFETFHVAAGQVHPFPVSLLIDPLNRAHDPRVSRTKFLKAYTPSLEKKIYFANSRTRAVLGHNSNDAGSAAGMTRKVDVNGFMTDIKYEVERRGGWEAYLRLIKAQMDERSERLRVVNVLAASATDSVLLHLPARAIKANL